MLAAPGALLVVWTTNRTAHHTFITESLFPHWGASRVATWYWVKVSSLSCSLSLWCKVYGGTLPYLRSYVWTHAIGFPIPHV